MINRDLLAYKLIEYGVNGKFYRALKALYSEPIACVRLNEYHTNWFPTLSGVKQSDALFPTLFAIYINDLANEIKALTCGVMCGGEMISILLYADDIVLLLPSEDKLQQMLSYTNEWCKKIETAYQPKEN